MFDNFFKGLGEPEKSPLTTLDLKTPPPSPEPKPATPASQQPPLKCRVMHFKDEAQKAAVIADLKKRLGEWTESGQRPVNIYFGVLPQQGLPTSFTSPDGKLTMLYFFDTPFAAKYAFEKLQVVPQVAGCRVSAIPEKAEKWISAGINSFAMTPCRLCGPRNVFRADNLLSLEKFTQALGAEAVQRGFRAQALALQTQMQIGKNNKAARASLEYLRDHFDAGNPYVHWMIAVLAGMDGDMKANAESIVHMEQFGPPFVGKLHGTSFDMSPGSQFATFPEAMMGLLLSYKCLDPEKLAKKPPAPPNAG